MLSINAIKQMISNNYFYQISKLAGHVFEICTECILISKSI